jgi:SpoVK/Ycf46/Vps4 family AAA+-type ATPase
MTDHNDLDFLIRGHTPIIAIESFEERQALDHLLRIAVESTLPLFQWTATDGLHRIDIDLGAQKHIAAAQDVLRHIKSSGLQGLYALLDFDPWLNDPVNIRLLKEIAMQFDGNHGKLILISHHSQLPDSLSRLSVLYRLRLPNTSELEQLIKTEAQAWQQQTGQKVRTDRPTLDRMIKNLSGLSLSDAKRLIRNAIINDGAITESDLPEIMQAKYRLLNRDSTLSFEYDTQQFSDVGGMEELKKWLLQRQTAFAGDAGNHRLDRPKGILLLGVQGCGKSLAAKAVPGIWGVPLLRLDFGQLYNKYIGETERNLRQALHTAEVMAPCVLWIDELEKGIASGDEDEGTSRRMLGTLLTWMAENTHPVFIVATANQIDILPPELIRKGRLDEIFFVDLPGDAIRTQIFHIHLARRGIPFNTLDMPALTKASAGFSGAEIEQVIVAITYHHHHTRKAIDTQMLLDEISRTRPLSVVMAEDIASLRLWARERTVSVD